MQLLQRSQAGDVAAFTALVRRYEEKVYNIAYRLVGNSADAADVAQETFIAAYEGLERFRGESAFYTWLYRIAVNRALTHRKARDSRPEFASGASDDPAPVELAGDTSEEPAAMAETKELQATIQAAISKLPEEFRAVVVLKDVEEFEYEEIADVLSIALGTVKSRLHRGRMLLRTALAHYIGTTP